MDAGSAYGYTERIDRMMAVIGDEPVLWVDTRTMKERGHYASEHMRLFNQALEKAHARYPALHVYEWSANAPAMRSARCSYPSAVKWIPSRWNHSSRASADHS